MTMVRMHLQLQLQQAQALESTSAEASSSAGDLAKLLADSLHPEQHSVVADLGPAAWEVEAAVGHLLKYSLDGTLVFPSHP